MLDSEHKHLQFACGPYALLLPLDAVIEIAEYNNAICAPSPDSFSHHGHNTTWRQDTLPYIDLRLALNLPQETLGQPLYVLALQDTDNNQPATLVAVDHVDRIISIQEYEWHWINGISSDIDNFFDRLYPENGSNKLMMRLANPARWLGRIMANSDTENHNNNNNHRNDNGNNNAH